MTSAMQLSFEMIELPAGILLSLTRESSQTPSASQLDKIRVKPFVYSNGGSKRINFQHQFLHLDGSIKDDQFA